MLIMAITCAIGFTACTDENSDNQNGGNTDMNTAYQMRIIVGDTELIADMNDSSTSAAIKEMLPMELNMLDLYGREMCYRFDDALPTDQTVSNGYELGELAYWPPRHSFVILYEQNGEHFSRQVLGKIRSGWDVFGSGDTTVRFELVEE